MSSSTAFVGNILLPNGDEASQIKNNTDNNIASPQTIKPTSSFMCIECMDELCQQESYCHNASQCFQALIIDSPGYEKFARGCIQKEENVPFICSTSYKTQSEYYKVRCCQGNLCNNETFSDFNDYLKASSISGMMALYMVLAILGCIALLASFGIVLFRSYCKKRKLKYFCKKPRKEDRNRAHFKYLTAGDSSLQEILTESLTSGSGSGLPLFVQRTLAKNINLEDMIGKGQYGEVWKGNWQGETVAVKIFCTRNESSWARETEIYSTLILRHENILGFYGSDMTSNASCTQLWLVTQYLPKGSLFDYLNLHTVDLQQLFTICLSVVKGILFLHTEIMGNLGKPAIVHRDINSKHVLVKDDGSCCLSNFGIAAVRVPETGEINLSPSSRMMVWRYASPEFLDDSFDAENFDAFRQSDIYSLSIVMWEALSRFSFCNFPRKNYEAPFFHLFPSDEPSYEDMCHAVCILQERPLIPEEWKLEESLSGMIDIISEGWHYDPAVRLTALRIKKDLTRIAENLGIEILL